MAQQHFIWPSLPKLIVNVQSIHHDPKVDRSWSIPLHKNIGKPGAWDTETIRHWEAGTPRHWEIVRLGRWLIGTLGGWVIGSLESCDSGPLEH